MIYNSEINFSIEDNYPRSKSFKTEKIEAEIVKVEICAISCMYDTGADIHLKISLKYLDVIYTYILDDDVELNIKL